MSLRMSARQASLLGADVPAAKVSDRDKWRHKIENQMAAAGIRGWDEEFLFAKHLGRRWRFDYAFPYLKIALEIEGAVFGRTIRGEDGKVYRLGGRHSTGAGLTADALKYNRAAILGWLVIRATTTMVRDGDAIKELLDAFKARRAA